MYTNSIKDFSLDSKYLNLSFFGNKLNIGIIGAGRGAFIKAKTFLDKGCNVEVLALNFIEDFEELKRNGTSMQKFYFFHLKFQSCLVSVSLVISLNFTFGN